LVISVRLHRDGRVSLDCRPDEEAFQMIALFRRRITASDAAKALSKHQHATQRARMLQVARAIRKAKGLPDTEALNG
jgi:hypothetical protein